MYYAVALFGLILAIISTTRAEVCSPSLCLYFVETVPSSTSQCSGQSESACLLSTCSGPSFMIQYRDYHVLDLLQLPHDRVTKSRWIFGRWAHYNGRDVGGSSTKYNGCDHYPRKRSGCSHTRHRLFTIGCRNEVPIGEEKQCEHLTPLRGLCAIPSSMSTYSCRSVLFSSCLVSASCSRFEFFEWLYRCAYSHT